MSREFTIQTAAGISAEDIINPVALAKKLQADPHPFAQHLFRLFTPAGRAALTAVSETTAQPELLPQLLANELSAIVAGGQSLFDPNQINGIKLRKSTNKLGKKNPQGAELVRLNTLLVQDYFSAELRHDSCELVKVETKKGIEFRIYREERKLKTKWSHSFKISYFTAKGQTSTHARSLEEAYKELPNLAEATHAAKTPVTKMENKNRNAKAEAYDAIAKEVALVGKKDAEGILEFVKDAVKAQLKLGDRPLLEFVTDAVNKLVKPVVRCLLHSATTQFNEFIMARRDVSMKTNRRVALTATRFAVAMRDLVSTRKNDVQFPGNPAPHPHPDVFVDESTTIDVQKWVNGIGQGWKYRRDHIDEVRAFLKYCRDALFALPPNMPTAAHLVPRPKPDSDFEPVPATVLSNFNVWRLLINLQDLESVWFFAMGVFAGLHQTEMLRLVWEYDIKWNGKLPTQIFIASGKGKDKHGKRLGSYVDIKPPLARLLAVGKGRTGKIFKRKHLRQDKLTPFAKALGIEWDESIMRHTFISNLFGEGCTIEEVCRQARCTVAVIRRHYYAPIEKLEAERFFAPPIDFEPIVKLPLYERNWDWKSLQEIQVMPEGNLKITMVAASVLPPRSRKPRMKRMIPINWPDDLKLQVLIWEVPMSKIGQTLNCKKNVVSAHARKRKLVIPPSYYFTRLKYKLPVEIPATVIKAREALAARQTNGATPNAETQPPKIAEPATPRESAPEPGENGNLVERQRMSKLQWPPKADFLELLWTKRGTQIARELNRHDSTVFAMADALELPRPPKDYWLKRKFGDVVEIPDHIKDLIRQLREGENRTTSLN
jgi:hypothetical protein